ncbi:hemolysin D [Niallia circulans]|jgi:hemolysin III|uniref:Hemolysin D n=1 Tax=Niallia circulans TaxID=1397 RepID=A0A0J1IPM0_NIACI|nr:hemolysin III family protein [Niallia circulans]AYV66768.1 hemolysin D [Niallia circulans]AYV70377.1 hemolysin D [Niallia circulans]KLV27899.1 hemolysin D [Niallia circulans]MCM2983051.1 hemolysin III family protein [Niallia circulans]MDR4314701.1 hemolysin III family protein [Niallia circulans]
MNFSIKDFSLKEEIANSITHGIGFLLSIPALVMLIINAVETDNPWRIVSFSIFGATMIILYLCSTLLHSITHEKVKDFFEILDHSSIYLLIAGTYTPFVLVAIRGGLGWTLFGIVWALAIIGIVFKCYYVKKYIVTSTILYVIMGWLIVMAIVPLYHAIGTTGFMLLVGGGLLYTIGSIFYVMQKIPYFHAIWHLFVLAGSALMYFCVYLYV